MECRRLIRKDQISAGIALWNQENPNFQIIPALVAQNIYAPFAGVNSTVWGYYQGEELVAFLLVKYLTQPIVKSADCTLGWISLLVISSKISDHQFIGQKLIKKAETDLAERSVQKIRFGGDPQNFLPGLPEEMVEKYLPILKKSGYQSTGMEYDLYGDLLAYTPAKKVRELELPADLQARPVVKEEEEKLLQFLQVNFPGRWFYEADNIRRIPGGVEDYWLLWSGSEVAGFVRTNTSESAYLGPNVNWGNRFGDRYCGLGPIGISKGFRGRGWGLYLMDRVIASFKERGFYHMVIDWTGLVDYYAKLGFNPVSKYHTLYHNLV